MESLISELDALAVRLGEEEAKRNQNFIEVEEFQHGEKSESNDSQELYPYFSSFVKNSADLFRKDSFLEKFQIIFDESSLKTCSVKGKFKNDSSFVRICLFFSGVNAEDLNRKLMKLEIQKNRLIAVIEEKEAELINEKKESENVHL